MKNLLSIISILLLPTFLMAEVQRIQTTRFDRAQVKVLYLAPGLGSIVLFPCPLVEVFLGRSEDVKAQISPSDKKVLFLNLKLNSSYPTNLIAKCEGERIVFVFDVISSRNKHQDVVEISSYFGRPKSVGNQLVTMEVKKRSFLVKSPTLISSGGQK